MNIVRIASTAVAAAWLAASQLAPVGLVAQTPQQAWVPEKTADGQPDIQGYWAQRNNVTTYSLERGDEDRREHNRITGQRAAMGAAPLVLRHHVIGSLCDYFSDPDLEIREAAPLL